jgi:hypothetical protein
MYVFQISPGSWIFFRHRIPPAIMHNFLAQALVDKVQFIRIAFRE